MNTRDDGPTKHSAVIQMPMADNGHALVGTDALRISAALVHYHLVQAIPYLLGYLLLYLLIANGVLSLIGAACTALFDRWVFSTAGLVSFGAWNMAIAACFLLIAISTRGGLEERALTRNAATDSAA